MTADDMPSPQAPTPRTAVQKAAIWGHNAVADDPDGFDLRHALVAEAALSPESMPFPDEPAGGTQ